MHKDTHQTRPSVADARMLRGHAAARLRRVLALAALLLLLVAPLSARAWLDPAPELPGAEGALTFPSVFVDETGLVHTIWMQSFGGNFAIGALYYRRGELFEDEDGLDILWGDLIGPLTSSASRNNPPTILVDSSGVVHVAYGDANGTMIYLRNEGRGGFGWQVEEIARLGDDDENVGLGLGLDSSGTPYIAWATAVLDPEEETIARNLVLSYRTGEQQWTEPRVISPPVNLARKLRMVVQGSGPAAIVHVFYETRRFSFAPFTVDYTRGARDGDFVESRFSVDLGIDPESTPPTQAADPFVALDPQTNQLVVVLSAGSIETDFASYFTTSADSGATWRAPALLNLGPGVWPELTSLAINNGVVHMASEQKFWDAQTEEFTAYQVWYQTYTLASGQFSAPERISGEEVHRRPIISASDRAEVVVWVENSIERALYNVDAADPAQQPVNRLSLPIVINNMQEFSYPAPAQR